MEARILAAGREQLAASGAAALSLREVARSLGVVSSAVYRYVASRDELLTLLLVDAFEDLADAADVAVSGEDEPSEAFAALARSLRSWALANPARWALLYGSPVPGYAAPAERTSAPGTRVMTRLLRIAAAGTPPGREPAGAHAAFLAEAVRELDVEATGRQAAAAVEAWTAVVGTVSAELFGQLGPMDDTVGAAILDGVIDAQRSRLGLAQRPHSDSNRGPTA